MTRAISPRSKLVLALAASALAYPVGLLLGGSWLLPALNTLPAYLLMVDHLRRGERRKAVTSMLAWALTLAVAGVVTFTLWPSDPGPRIVNGPQYRDEMFTWIRTGVGSEGDWRQFLPQHVAHLAAFMALSLATASLASIFMGAVLMNYMDYYVASLARAGAPAWAFTLCGWQPWAICRVAAFCTLGVILAEPLLSRLLRYRYDGLGRAKPYLIAAAAGILADWLLKAAIAPSWGEWLRAALP